jgi:transcriptional regulator with XRE-family HTH domain
MKEIIGQRVTKFRNLLRITQEDFANNLDVDRSHIANLEVAKVFPNFVMLQNIHNKYGINLNWLICGSGKMKMNESDNNILEEPVSVYGNNRMLELYEENRSLLKENAKLKEELLVAKKTEEI